MCLDPRQVKETEQKLFVFLFSKCEAFFFLGFNLTNLVLYVKKTKY